jgi:O-methyltransferase
MIDEYTYCTNLAIAASVQSVPGAVVECGVWRGGMCAGLANLLGPRRDYWLFDSFEGLPPAKDIDGKAALAWQEDKAAPGYYQNCSAEESFAQEAMKRAGAVHVNLVKGWFEHTLPDRTIPGGISLLRLDGDWYDSTMTCLEALFQQVVPGGLIVIDDYYTWDGCSRAVHDYLSQTAATERISSLDNVCFIKRRHSSIPS